MDSNKSCFESWKSAELVSAPILNDTWFSSPTDNRYQVKSRSSKVHSTTCLLKRALGSEQLTVSKAANDPNDVFVWAEYFYTWWWWMWLNVIYGDLKIVLQWQSGFLNKNLRNLYIFFFNGIACTTSQGNAVSDGRWTMEKGWEEWRDMKQRKDKNPLYRSMGWSTRKIKREQ